MSAIITAIRELEASGEIALIQPTTTAELGNCRTPPGAGAVWAEPLAPCTAAAYGPGPSACLTGPSASHDPRLLPLTRLGCRHGAAASC